MVVQGSLQHLPAVNTVPVYAYSNNWDRLIACREIRPGSGNVTEGCVDRGMNGGAPNTINLNDPMFFHPQHPHSVENFDRGIERPYTPMALPPKAYPAYQLPGLSYEMRPDGGLAVRNCNKRAIDGAGPQDGEAAIKKRRLVAHGAH
ncbi:hypothetical protein RhiLY_12419 [Ceratobasidium sp. AG-Ba]|nr:hypothetical protein RhiLY_12419 [Ceratobasidium sp. AG-Ba]